MGIPKVVSAYTFKKQLRGSLPLFSNSSLLCWLDLVDGGFWCLFVVLAVIDV